MFNFLFSWKHLFFLRSAQPAEPVPRGLHRYWLETPRGPIEILAAEPATLADPDAPAIVFCHGGMGGAWVWTEYMQFLVKQGVRCYAVSLRGHGDSWSPHYLKMVYGTSRGDFEKDLVGAVEWVQQHTGGDVVLVGHSAGGGLSQGILAQGRVRARGLALLGAIPACGSMPVYMNWARLDPWFTLRMIFHLWHPNSSVSHPVLTQRAFFGDKFPLASVMPFQHRMNRFESLWWPLAMMRPFATAGQILDSIRPGKGDRVLVMAGDQDKLMTPEVTLNTTAFYKAVLPDGNGVRMELVEGAGHHLQNDVQWEDGAKRLLEWYKQL